MAKPIIGMVPPGGWHYYQSDVKLTGYSYDNLLKVVETYRAENHFDGGDIEGDVNSYICANWPNFCHGVDMVVVTSVNRPTATSELMNDVQTWAKNILNSTDPHPLVTDDLAEARAQTCRGCPNNVNWRGGCSSCITAIERITASVRQARDTKSSAVLGGCALMRHDNRAAIFMDRSVLQRATNLPENCWVNI
jgi:hypothetical protein